MTVRHAPWTLPMMLAIGTTACGLVLGDFPDGQLDQGRSLDAGDGGGTVANPSGTLAETICTVSNGTVLDMAIDDTDIFWLRAPLAGGQDFAVEACAKNGTSFRRIAAMPTQPQALALSNDYVLWSVHQDLQHSGGVWRGNKRGGLQEMSPWIALDNTGALAFMPGVNHLYVGSDHGEIDIDVPDNDAGHWGGLHPGVGDPPNSVASIVSSKAILYWSRQGPNDISTVPVSTDQVDGHGTLAGGFPSAPSFLSYDDDNVYWAVVESSGNTTIYSQCDNGCTQPTRVVTQPTGFQTFAVRGDAIYWTANEGGNGVVRGCKDIVHTKCAGSTDEKSKVWSSNARVSRVALDDANVYFAASVGADTDIVRHPR